MRIGDQNADKHTLEACLAKGFDSETKLPGYTDW